jgi:ribosomal protein L4
MVNCVIHDWQGAEAGKASFELKTANEENAPHIVHRALIRQLANQRQGTASTKGNRSRPCRVDSFSTMAGRRCVFWP